MYALIDPNAVYQGDIIKGFHFIVPPTNELQILEKNNEGNFTSSPISQISNPYSSGKATVAVNSFLANAIVISQTCDIQRRDYIHLCPVYQLSLLTQELINKGYTASRIDNVLKDLKSQKINYYFYLPTASLDGITIEESYVDLQLICMLPQVNIGLYNRFISLSDKGRHWLSFKLVNLYGRPF